MHGLVCCRAGLGVRHTGLKHNRFMHACRDNVKASIDSFIKAVTGK